MADFFQNGTISTLPNITKKPLDKELKEFAKRRNMVLLLPALYTEFDGPAMTKIISELKKVDYLYRIVLSLDRADKKHFMQIKEIMSEIPGDVKIVWHDGPRIQNLAEELKNHDFWLDYPGKGRSVWMTLGYILADKSAYAIGLHDCDILNYDKQIVARLFYPIVHPAFNFEFSKGYYARVTDKLYGRVTRLFITPLIRSLKKILGFNPFLEYLDSFRYALSGEFAFIRSLARGINISPTWGLEMSMLSEVYQHTSTQRVTQVEIIDTYEHKHQEFDLEKPKDGLIRMANDITKTLLRVLTQDGIVMSESFFRTLLTTYLQKSKEAIERYDVLSMINSLKYERHAEIDAVDAFVESLQNGINEFIVDPVSIPMLPAWIRVRAAMPDFLDKFVEAVEEDNK